ncbi:MAG: hypothetical protein ACLFVT_04420, partial [Syntrophobacteria bacterium]
SQHQGQGSRAAVAKVLAELGTEKDVINEVLQIIYHPAREAAAGSNSIRIVSDARNLGKLIERRSLLDEQAMERLIEQRMQTETGRRLARERLL